MFQAIILGILQGVSELFPVSSLGHTVLFPSLFGWHSVVKAQSNPESFWLALVVMLHVGSAIGLLIYFWRDWVQIIAAWFRTLAKRRIETPTERLAWLIVVGSIPAGVIGLVLEHPLRVALAKPEAAAFFLILNGCILLAAERLRRRSEVKVLAAREGAKEDGGRKLDTLNYREAGVIGVAQSTALIAGISREGMCMTAGLVRGMDHEDSARFAFLLATPIILAAGLFKVSDLTGPLGNGVRGQALVAAACAAVTAVFSVRYLMSYFKTRTLTPFGIYCILFGVAMAIFTAVN
jgi:undecaprenyl-diphosphatase